MIETSVMKELIFQNSPVQFFEEVPDDIDDSYVYEVPKKADFSNCKGDGH